MNLVTLGCLIHAHVVSDRVALHHEEYTVLAATILIGFAFPGPDPDLSREALRAAHPPERAVRSGPAHLPGPSAPLHVLTYFEE